MRAQKRYRMTHTRETALRLVKYMGFRAAMDYCKENHWSGVVSEIKTLRNEKHIH